MTNNFIEVEKKLYDLFLGWYLDNIGNYNWSPAYSDRKNIFSKEDEVMAYETSGLITSRSVVHYYIRDTEYKLLMSNYQPETLNHAVAKGIIKLG